MSIDPERLLAIEFPLVEQNYTERDVMLYALGVGFGQNPVDANELTFVYEKNLKVLPTFPVVLGSDPFLIRRTGVNFAMGVHGDEQLVVHRPIATSGVREG